MKRISVLSIIGGTLVLMQVQSVLASSYVSPSGKVYEEVTVKTTSGCKYRELRDLSRFKDDGGKSYAWSGACKNGFLDGEGVLKTTDKDGNLSIYKGRYKDGREEGFGVLEVAKQGAKAYVSGYKVRGQFQGACRLTMQDADGKTLIYTGTFTDDLPTGRGRIEAAEGIIYEGDVLELVPNGAGKYKYPSGITYEGGVKNNKPHGEGVFTHNDGTRIKGYFIDGGSPNSGRIDYSDGSYYEGELRNLEPNGRGTSMSPDRTRFSGIFANGRPDGEGVIEKAGGQVSRVRITNNGVELLQPPGGQSASGNAQVDQQAYQNAVNACRLRVSQMPAPKNVGEVLMNAAQCNIDPELFRTQTVNVRHQEPLAKVRIFNN